MLMPYHQRFTACVVDCQSCRDDNPDDERKLGNPRQPIVLAEHCRYEENGRADGENQRCGRGLGEKRTQVGATSW